MKHLTAVEYAQQIIALYAVIEGNKIKNAYEIGRKLTKAKNNPSKTFYTELEKAILANNKVEKTTIAKYRKLYKNLEPLQHSNPELLNLLKEVSSFTVIEKLTDLSKPAILALFTVTDGKLKYKSFLETLTTTQAENFNMLIKKEGMEIDTAIETMKDFSAFIEKNVQPLTETDEEDTDETTPTVKNPDVIDFAFALSIVIANMETATEAQIDQLIEAIEKANEKALKTA